MVFLNILRGPITFYQKGGHVLQKEDVWSPYRICTFYTPSTDN